MHAILGSEQYCPLGLVVSAGNKTLDRKNSDYFYNVFVDETKGSQLCFLHCAAFLDVFNISLRGLLIFC